MSFPKINVVRKVGELNKVWFLGKVYHRQRALVIQWEGGLVSVPCAQYDDHFLFRVAQKDVVRGSGLWCSCGSPAVIVGHDTIKDQTSDHEAKVVCFQKEGVIDKYGRKKHLPVNWK